MKLFKDVAVGEHFVMHNGQQLIRISPLTQQSHNCLDYPWYDKRFAIDDDTECLTVDELMALADEPEDIVEEAMTEMQKQVSMQFADAFAESFKKMDWAAVAAEEKRLKQEAVDRNEWIVETKIADSGVTVEVSAVIKDSHGHISWGWHGEHKQVVLSTSKTYGKMLPVSQAMLALAQEEAQRICDSKN